MRPDIICSLDIKTSSIRVLIAQLSDSYTKEKILGLSEFPAKGFSRGVVSKLSELSDIIESAVSKAEGAARCRVRKLITNISGVHIRTFKSRGSIHISDRPAEITEEDIKRCIESARLIAMSLDREVLHLIQERFFIDDKMEIDDPLGLFGSKLDVDLNIITSLVSILQNITKAVNLAGYEVEEIIASGAATALAVFEEKQLEEGAVLIDIGRDVTEATLFRNGRLWDSFYFPFGSDDITQVLQDRLSITFEEAEDMRIKYAIVTKENLQFYDDGPILIPSCDRAGVISRREISNMLFPKVEEIMQNVYKKIEPFLRQHKKIPHISVVGSLSGTDGFVEAVEDIFCVPVNMGTIRGMKELQDTGFASCMGLIRYAARKRAERKKYVSGNFAGRLITRIRSRLSEYF